MPDASRITPPVLLPGQASPVRLSLWAVIGAGGGPVDPVTLDGSLHLTDTSVTPDGLAVRLLPGERLDRDVLLRWPLPAGGLRTDAVLSPDPNGPAAGRRGAARTVWEHGRLEDRR